MKVKDIIKDLQEYKNQDYELVYDMFDAADIKNYAEDYLEITMTDAQVSEAIKYLEKNADANEGMSWDTIEYAIEQIMEDAE